MRVGIIGAGGFVGKSLLNALTDSKELEAVPIYRNDNLDILSKELDFVIHSANPASRFMANSDPITDHAETILKTQFLLNSFRQQRFVLISSISCRTQLETVYGQNRKECERKVLQQGGVVLRLGPLYGGSRVKDTLHDIVKGEPVYVSADTKYAYVDVSWISRYLIHNLGKFTGLNEFGAKNTITIGEIAKAVNSQSQFLGLNDDQFPIGFSSGPDAYQVLEYANILKRGILASLNEE